MKNGMNISRVFFSIASIICSIMVVGLHAHNVTEEVTVTLSARIVSTLTHGVFTAAVPIFFFMSGLLFFRNVESLKDVYQKQKKRIVSVFMPFVAWSTFYFIIYAIATNVLSGANVEVELSFLGIVKGIILYKHAFHLWYMFELILYIILTPVIYTALKKNAPHICLLRFLCFFVCFVKK